MNTIDARRLLSAGRALGREAYFEDLEPRKLLSVAIETTDLSLGEGPTGIVVADFDGDELLDLASVNLTSQSISIVRNLGDGQFAEATEVEFDGTPSMMFAMDIDEDGMTDLGVVDQVNGAVTLLRNAGDGSFEAHEPIELGEGATNFVFAHLDGDDDLDIAVTFDDGTLTIFHPGVDDPFQSDLPRQIGDFLHDYFESYPEWVNDFLDALGGPGTLDQDFIFNQFLPLFANNFEQQFLSQESFLEQSGQEFNAWLMNWLAQWEFDPEIGPDGTPQGADIWQDFGDDFVEDYLVSQFPDTDIDQFFNHDGDGDGGDGTGGDGSGDDGRHGDDGDEFPGGGTLRDHLPHEDYAFGGSLEHLVIADFNADGRNDIGVSDPRAGVVHIMVTTSDDEEPFDDIVTFDVGALPSSLAATDADGDGFIDLIATSRDYNRVAILLNNGVDGLEAPSFMSVGKAPVFVTTGDIDGDGFDEIITANARSGSLTVISREGNAEALTRVADLVAGEGTSAALLVDFDGDGQNELVALNTGSDSATVFSFTFDDDDSGLATPLTGAPDLVAASDTGESNTDNITALENGPASQLTFSVGNVIPGAVVRLYLGNLIVAETQTESDDQELITAEVTTLGRHPLPEGHHFFRATQIVQGIESGFSTALDVTVRLPQVDDGSDVQVVENEDGDTIVQIQSESDDAPVEINLSSIQDAPRITGTIVPAMETKSDGGVTYAAGPTDEGFVLFAGGDDGQWASRNLTEEIEDSEPITSNVIKSFTTPWGFVNYVGFNDDGDLLVYWQDGGTTEGGDFNWEFVNLYDNQLRALGQGAPTFVGDITVYVTEWGGLNIAGIDEDGNLQVVWWAPASGNWVSTNLTAELGGDALAGRVSAFVELPDTMRLFATTENNQLVMYHWDPENAWVLTEVSGQASQDDIAEGSVAGFVDSVGTIVTAGVDTSGDQVHVFWFTAADAEWDVVTIDVADDAPLVGQLRLSEGDDGELTLRAQSAGGEVVELSSSLTTYDTWAAA